MNFIFRNTKDILDYTSIMQIFVPYRDPILVAQCLDKRRLNKQIIECHQILDALKGKIAWSNHPVVKMYKCNIDFVIHYSSCLEYWRDGYRNAALYSNYLALECIPSFIVEEFCIQHRRRLYTKAPDLYPQFAEYGESEENWYYVDGKLVKYINGKRIL